MNKPDWKDAPEWANWLAQDEVANGECWVWFEDKPYFNNGCWMPSSAKKWLQTNIPSTIEDAENTLEPRP